LIKILRDRIQINEEKRDEVIRTLENLFLGFQGAGRGRTWCAQSFLPVSPQLLARESIWKKKKAEHDRVKDWDSLFNTRSSFFDMNQHLFLARGGELIYLQLCHALRQPERKIVSWNCEKNLGLTDNEQSPEWLYKELSSSLSHLMDHCPSTLNKLADFIDRGLDPQTAQYTDYDGKERRFVKAGWCHIESWQEGYLFGVALCRLLQNSLDVVDRIHLLEHLCAMQVLRTLALRSAQVLENEAVRWPGYRLVVSAPEDKRPAIRRLSQQSLKVVEKQIFQALRGPAVQLPDDLHIRDKLLNQADKSYGGKLFISLAKRIGLVVPKRGAGARFVMNEQILRLLVFTTVSPGERLTFDTFKKRQENCWGFVFDASGLARANRWLNGKDLYLPADTDKWLQEMLGAAGFLIHLSDSCALVYNPTGIREEER
jgi:tetrahydromethanopterin S-methyltransferase subunit B